MPPSGMLLPLVAAIALTCTLRSLVILDELGRGSSTADGSAIAYAVVQVRCPWRPFELFDSWHWQKLLNHSNCAALISTHFHNLVEEVPSALATPMHMSAIVDEASASVTFLYKLVEGCRFKQPKRTISHPFFF
jgi:DNA mismatch repair ATPase MutS